MKRAALALTCFVVVASACAAPAPAAPTPVEQAPRQSTPEPTPAPISVQAVVPAGVPSSVPRSAGPPTPAILPLSVLAGHSGSDLRVALDDGLDEDLFLQAEAMQAANSSRLDELIGVSAMLDQVALVFAETVGTVRGQPAAAALLDAWRAQSADLIAYAQGQSSSAADLDRQRGVIAVELATGSLQASTVDDVLQHRMQQELGLADALSAHDPTQVVQRLTDLQATSDDLGRPLAAAMAAQLHGLSPPDTEGADVTLRVHLNSDAVNQVYWTGAAMDAAADGRSADAQAFSSAADQSAENTANELAAVYGADVGSGVSDRLHTQVSALVSAASGGDRHQATSDIERARSEIDGLLSNANALLAPGLLNQLQRGVDQPLLTAADAFRARDFNTAWARVQESAKSAHKPTDTLALAIVDRYPGRYLILPPASRQSPDLGGGRGLRGGSPGAPHVARGPQGHSH